MSHEAKKVGKIVDEMLTYLLLKGAKDIQIDIKYEESEVKIQFIFFNLLLKEAELLTDTLAQTRDELLEEYAWGLIGENDYACELNLLGMCIDDFTMLEENGRTLIELRRNLK